MLVQSNNKIVLWVSKDKPPVIEGAKFDAHTSGRTAVSNWKTNKYVAVLIDTGIMSDGLTGFDVVRNIRALNNNTVIYLMATNAAGSDTILAQRLRVKDIITKSPSYIQKALQQSNAINWGLRSVRIVKESVGDENRVI